MREESKAAARWWADQFRKSVDKDNGDAFQSAFMTMMVSRTEPLTDEQVTRFEEALARRIDERWDDGAWSFNRYIGVDYHPDALLEQAVCDAGLDDVQFDLLCPIKTSMWLEEGHVTVSCGYGQPRQEVYTHEAVRD